MRHSTPSEKRNGFRIHAVVFVLTLVLLAVINVLTGAPYWVLWIVPGWAIGLFTHWFFVLGPGAARPRDDPEAGSPGHPRRSRTS